MLIFISISFLVLLISFYQEVLIIFILLQDNFVSFILNCYFILDNEIIIPLVFTSGVEGWPFIDLGSYITSRAKYFPILSQGIYDNLHLYTFL